MVLTLCIDIARSVVMPQRRHSEYCTARQCSPLRRKFMECYIVKPAQLLLMKHLVIGQR